jgi:hypothetical protein
LGVVGIEFPIYFIQTQPLPIKQDEGQRKRENEGFAIIVFAFFAAKRVGSANECGLLEMFLFHVLQEAYQRLSTVF